MTMPWQLSQHDTGRQKMDRSTELNRLLAEYRVMEKAIGFKR
jgi:hypothetical protein